MYIYVQHTYRLYQVLYCIRLDHMSLFVKIRFFESSSIAFYNIFLNPYDNALSDLWNQFRRLSAVYIRYFTFWI